MTLTSRLGWLARYRAWLAAKAARRRYASRLLLSVQSTKPIRSFRR